MQAISILGQIEVLLLRCPTYGLLVGASSGQGPRPDFNNGPGDNSNSGRILPQRLFESNANNGPSRGHSNLGKLKKITTAYTIAALFILLFFPKNDMWRALSKLNVLTKIV